MSSCSIRHPLSRWCLKNGTSGGPAHEMKPWNTSPLPAFRAVEGKYILQVRVIRGGSRFRLQPAQVSGRAGRLAAAASRPNTVPRHTLSVPGRRRRSCRHQELVRGATRQSSWSRRGSRRSRFLCDGAAAEGWIISRATSTLRPNCSAAKATASRKFFPTRATASVSAYAVRWSRARYTVLPEYRRATKRNGHRPPSFGPGIQGSIGRFCSAITLTGPATPGRYCRKLPSTREPVFSHGSRGGDDFLSPHVFNDLYG